MSDFVMTSMGEDSLDRRSKILSVIIHLLLLLIAFWPLFDRWDASVPETVVIEFVDQVVQDQPSQQPIATSEKTAKHVPPIPNVDESQKAQPAKSTADKKADLITEEREVITAAPKKPAETRKTRDFGSLFGQGSQENTHDRKSTKDLSSLSSIGVTSTSVGQGLTGRQVAYAPRIEDNSQKTGLVVVQICVDREGKVISAKYTQRGSTTNDQYLINKAEEAALKWKFARSEEMKQCGAITIDFKLK